MAISVVNTTPANSLSITIPATTAGNCLVVCIGAYPGGEVASVSGITLGGSADNFAQLVTAQDNTLNDSSAFIWADPGCAGGQTAVVISGSNLTVDSGDGGVTVYEVAGLVTSSVLDQSSPGTNNSGNWSSGATPQTTQAAEIFIGAMSSFNGGITGPSSPWNNTAYSFAMTGYQIVASEQTATYSGTQTSSSWSAVVVTLKGAGGASTASAPQPAQPGRTWRRQFRPRALEPLPPQLPAPDTGVPYPQARPGQTWRRHFRAGEIRQMHPLQPPANQSPVYRPPGTFPARPGRTWRRQFRPRALEPLQPPQPQPVPPGTPQPSGPAQPGQAWRKQFRPRAQQQPLPNQGPPPPVPLPSGPIAPGQTWTRRFRPRALEAPPAQAPAPPPGPAAPVALPSPPIQPGRTWLRRFRPHALQAPPAAAPIPPTPGVPLPALPINPGPTWARRFQPRATEQRLAPPSQPHPTTIPPAPIQPGKTWRRRFHAHAQHILEPIQPPPPPPRPLIVSVASRAGTDDYGNTYPQGLQATEGVIEGPVLVGSDAFFYSPSPGAGNLTQSITQAAGTDQYGNAYLAGTTTYTNDGAFWSAVSIASGVINWYMATSEAGPWTAEAGIGFNWNNITGGGLEFTAPAGSDMSGDLDVSGSITVTTTLTVNGTDVGATLNSIITALSGASTTTNGLTDGTINGSSATAGLTNGQISGTSGSASAGTAHTHGAGSYAVSNGTHAHGSGSYAVTDGQHSHDLPTI